MHLANTSSQEKIHYLCSYGNYHSADVLILCEVMPSFTHLGVVNLNYRRATPHQLCYSAIEVSTGQTINLLRYEPAASDDYSAAGFKGGKVFSSIADRGIGHFQYNGVDIYVIHAPASHNAIKAVSYAACSLNELHGINPWLLLGDMNVEPAQLASAGVGINLNDLILTQSEPTHTSGKILDYALCNFVQSAQIERLRASLRVASSDHYPIRISF